MLDQTREKLIRTLLTAHEQKELTVNSPESDPIGILIEKITGESDGRWYTSLLYHFDRIESLPEGIPLLSYYSTLIGLKAEEMLMLDALWEGSKLDYGGTRHPLPAVEQDASISVRLDRVLDFLGEDVPEYA